MTAEELFNAFLNQTPEQRLETALQNGARILNFLEGTELDDQHKFSFLLHTIGMFVAADGNLTRGELELFNQVFRRNFSPEEVVELLSICADPNFVDEMDRIIDSLPDEIRFSICSVGLCFASADGELNEKELDLFAKILNK